MPQFPAPLDLSRLKVFPLVTRKSMAAIEDILIKPDAPPPPAPDEFIRARIEMCLEKIRAARARKASVMLLYGAHLVKNGAASLVNRLMEGGWITHLGTNRSRAHV